MTNFQLKVYSVKLYLKFVEIIGITETVYGLGADAFNASAVARVFEAKARPSFDPLILHIAIMANLTCIASIVP